MTTALVVNLPDCDICAGQGRQVIAQYDGKMSAGPWAFMCRSHFLVHGVGAGVGRGQLLQLAPIRPSECEHSFAIEAYWSVGYTMHFKLRCVRCGRRELKTYEAPKEAAR